MHAGTSKQSRNVEANKDKITPKRLLQRIPVAGLENLLRATTKNERRIWILVLIAALGATVYYLIPPIISFMAFRRVVEVTHKTTQDIPLPPFYVCINSAQNRSFFDTVINETIRKQMQNEPRVKSWIFRTQRIIIGRWREHWSG
jgi:hypothetical protein